jgi:hypothetical protein
MDNKIEPRDRSESEIAGYRDVLSTIHSAFDAIPVKSSVLLQLHRNLYKYIGIYTNFHQLKVEIIKVLIM